RAREERLQAQPARRANHLDLALGDNHLELLDLGAARRVLEVGQAVGVVVDAVPADLPWRRVALAVVCARAVVEAADEGATGAAAVERPAGAAAARDVAVADLARLDDPVATDGAGARIGRGVARARALVDAAGVLALDRLQVLADDLVAEGAADRRGANAA